MAKQPSAAPRLAAKFRRRGEGNWDRHFYGRQRWSRRRVGTEAGISTGEGGVATTNTTSGTPTGGVATGGSATGGTTAVSTITLGDKAHLQPHSTINAPTTGGTTTGGAAAGGAATGGTTVGDSATGGAGTGGAATGTGPGASASGT